MFLQGDDPEMGDLALVFVEIEAELKSLMPLTVSPRLGVWPAMLRDLELAARGAEDGGQPRRRVDDAGDIGKPARLGGDVVDRVEGRGRVLDPLGVVQILAGGVIIDLADPAALFGARLKRRLLAAIQRERAARIERPGLGLDVDDAGGAQAVLRRQRAGDQRHRIGEPRLQRLAEDVDPLGQMTPLMRNCRLAWSPRTWSWPNESCATPGACSSSWLNG